MAPLVTLLLLAANAQAAAPAPGAVPPARDDVRRPAIVPVPVTYSVKVQADPVLPKGERPEATDPAGERLAVSIQPERKSFPANGPLGITVTLTNKSDKALRLYGAEKLGKRPDLVLIHQKTGAQVHMTGGWDADLTQAPITIEPGKTYVRTFAVVAEGGVRPRPIPIPRPVPLPAPFPKPGLPVEKFDTLRGARDEQAEPVPADKAIADRAAADKAAEKEPAKIAPPGRFPGAIVPAPATIIPEGTIRLRLMLEFTAPEGAGKAEAPAWSGKLASAPIDIEFTPAVWKGPLPPAGGPLTKEQAVTVAQRAAEAALTAAYNPQDDVRPPKEGAWISDPGTATVKDRANNAGWTVSWTHTQKGKGHSYHVVIDVDANGQTTVREVFAGYSNR